MNRRTAVLALLVALAMAAMTPVASAKEVLRVAISTGYPPFNVLNADGSFGGFDVDYANLLCERMNMTCEFVDNEWDGIIPGLLAKKYDVIIASMGITEERKKQITFSNPYYQTPSSVIARKESGLKPDAEGLAGKAIGVQRATGHECYIQREWPKADMRSYPTTDEAYLDLVSGRIDAVLVDSIPGQDWLKAPANAGFAVIGADIYDKPCFGEGTGVGMRQDEPELLAAINAAIQKTREDGSYVALSNKYFGRDIYGQ
ncbi:MAG: transporter substrate-binding domain-containing protein [Aestuariivirga sp.]|uniref:transporter substrate-binding domain-containing protein n=1 Tax=Aestuariivirga sp. TaxID=2650926 RepID=UPI0038D1A2B1